MQMDDRPDDIAVGRVSGTVRIPGRGAAATSHLRGSRGPRVGDVVLDLPPGEADLRWQVGL